VFSAVCNDNDAGTNGINHSGDVALDRRWEELSDDTTLVSNAVGLGGITVTTLPGLSRRVVTKTNIKDIIASAYW
jgi:hypothetical protein